jgi:hypothetical protein
MDPTDRVCYFRLNHVWYNAYDLNSVLFPFPGSWMRANVL